MGERRKRKSLWDKEDDTKHFSGTNERNSRDHPGHPSRESYEENPVNGSFNKNRQNASERKEIGGENRDYNQKLSPGFDGMERQKYNNAPENDRSRPRRYPERGRSRSRSRSRTRGRSRSRSFSPGRGREKERGRGRSRSRSRSRSDDREHVPDKSSQICRDFALGKCRRGNQCRFLHPKNQDDKAESWRNRAYHEEDEQYPNKSRNSIPCKDFLKGKCRWGDTCRFSHSDETFGKGNRYSSLDKENESQSYRNGKSICKFFAAGKCDRDNCRFSHSSDTIVENPDYNAIKAKGDNKWGKRLENRNKNGDLPEWRDNSTNRDKIPSPPRKSGSYRNAESIGEENMGNSKGIFENNIPNSYQNGENVLSSDLNGSHTHLAGQMTGLTEITKVPENFPNLLTEHLAQLTNSAVAIAGQISQDPFNSVQSGTVNTEHENHKEQNNQIHHIGEENEGVDNNKQSETVHDSGKVEETSANKDMRIFKNSLIEFVKEILKPTWKEGRMSRDVYKTIVKKVVDKITGSIQDDHVPKTQDKVEQYLSVSKSKIAKLVQAYVGRCLKTDS